MVELILFNNLYFTSCITSHATLLLQDKLCYHERQDGLRAPYVALPQSFLIRNLSDNTAIWVTASGFL